MGSDQQQVRWGIIGTARIATRVAEAIRLTPGAEIAAVASRSADRAAAWAAEHGVSRSVEGYEALLADESLDAVYIPLPPAMHAEWTQRAAERGLHVLCEKPLAMTAAEAQQMADSCQRNGVQLMDATMWVHHPRAAQMRGLIDAEDFGSLRRVTSAFGFQLDNHLSANPPAAARTDRGSVDLALARMHELRLDRSLGGGSLMDLGWYCVRATLWAFRELPSKVFATARYAGGVDMNLSAIMWFSEDRVASFDCGFDIARRKWFEVCGDHQSLVCDDFVSPWDNDRPRFWLHDRDGCVAEHVSPAFVQEQLMIETMCDIIRSGELDSQWPQSSVDNQRVVEALDQSARAGQVVTMQ